MFIIIVPYQNIKWVFSFLVIELNSIDSALSKAPVHFLCPAINTDDNSHHRTSIRDLYHHLLQFEFPLHALDQTLQTPVSALLSQPLDLNNISFKLLPSKTLAKNCKVGC